MKRLSIGIALALVAAAGCRGAGGPGGADGIGGPNGPNGPLALAPQILDVTPRFASSASTLRLRVANVGTAGAPVVFFDGIPAEVVSTGATEIWVRGIPASAAGFTEISMDANGGHSNSISLPLGARGDARALAGGGFVDARGLALDADGQRILAFDSASGILRFDPATARLSTWIPAGGPLGNPQAGLVAGSDLFVADGASPRIMKVAADGAVTAWVTGLVAPAVALAADADGTLYWVNGATGSVGRRATDGTVDEAYVTAPGVATGITRAGTKLYVSDANAGAIHSITGTTVTANVATGLAGIRGLGSDGTDVVGCLTDGGVRGAIRMTSGGTVTTAAPPRPLAGTGASGCLFSGTTLWSIDTVDSGLDSFTTAGAWLLRAPALRNDVQGAIWAGTRLFVAAANRCPAGGGAIAEVFEDGSQQTVATDACADDTLAIDSIFAPTGLYWAEQRGTKVHRFDLATAVTTTVVDDATITGATGFAVSIDGKFFVGIPGGTARVAQFSAQGALLNSAVGGTAIGAGSRRLAVANTGLYAETSTRVVRFDIDGNGNAVGGTTLAGTNQQLTGFTAIAPDGNEGVLLIAGGLAYDLDVNGQIRLLQDVSGATGIARTPFGEILIPSGTDYPMARLQ